MNSCIFRRIYHSFKMSEQNEVFCFFEGKKSFFHTLHLCAISERSTLVFAQWRDVLAGETKKNTKNGFHHKFALF